MLFEPFTMYKTTKAFNTLPPALKDLLSCVTQEDIIEFVYVCVDSYAANKDYLMMMRSCIIKVSNQIYTVTFDDEVHRYVVACKRISNENYPH